MGLHLHPRRTQPLGAVDPLPYGQTHPFGTRCPFTSHDDPDGSPHCSCSLFAYVAADTLEQLGEEELCLRLHENMFAEDALEFATTLHETADRIEEGYRREAGRPDVSKDGWAFDAKTGSPVCVAPLSFETAVASVRRAADWYETVGRLGFDVRAMH